MPEKPGFIRVKPVNAQTCNAVGYRLGLKVADGKDYSMKGKREVIHAEIMLPDGAPSQFQDLDILCKSAEQAELQYNKTTKSNNKIRYGKELVVELDNRLSTEAKIATLRELAAGIVEEGYAVAMAVHEPKPGQKVIKGDGETDEVQKSHGHIFVFPRKIIEGSNNHEIDRGTSNPFHESALARSFDQARQQSGIYNEDDEIQTGLHDLRPCTLATAPARHKSILRAAARNGLSKRQIGRIMSNKLRWLAASADPGLIACWSSAKAKSKFKLDGNGQRIHRVDTDGNWMKDKKGGWCYVKYTEGIDTNEWRLKHESRWVDIVNAALEREGKPSETISMAQYSKMAGEWRLGRHDRKTQRHMGQKATALEKKGIRTNVGDFNRTVLAYNVLAATLANKQNELTDAESAFAASKQAAKAETPATTNLDLAPTIIDHGYYIDRNIDYSEFINIGNDSNDSDLSNYDFGMNIKENQLVLGPMPPTEPQAEPIPASVAAEVASPPPMPAPEPSEENVLAETISKSPKPAEVEPKANEPRENVLATTISVQQKEPTDTEPQAINVPTMTIPEQPIQEIKPAGTEAPVAVEVEPAPPLEKPINTPKAKPVPTPAIVEPPKPQFVGILNDKVSSYNYYTLTNGDTVKHILRHIKTDGTEDPDVIATQSRINSMMQGPVMAKPKTKPQIKAEQPTPPKPAPAAVIEPPKPTDTTPAVAKIPAKPAEPPKPVPVLEKPVEPRKPVGTQIPTTPKKSPGGAARPLQKSPAGNSVTKKPQPAPVPAPKPKGPEPIGEYRFLDDGVQRYAAIIPVNAQEKPMVWPIRDKSGALGALMAADAAEQILAQAETLLSKLLLRDDAPLRTIGDGGLADARFRDWLEHQKESDERERLEVHAERAWAQTAAYIARNNAEQARAIARDAARNLGFSR